MGSQRVGHGWTTFAFHKTNLIKKEVLIFSECFAKFIYYKIIGCLNFIFVVLWFMIRNIYLAFIDSSWRRAPKLVGFPVMRAVQGSCDVDGPSLVSQMVENPLAMWDLGSISGLFNEVTWAPAKHGGWCLEDQPLIRELELYFVLKYSPLGYGLWASQVAPVVSGEEPSCQCR